MAINNTQEKEVDERGMQELLQQIMDEFQWEHPSQDENNTEPEYLVRRVETFEEAGILTMNKGLVIGMGDGAEFQIEIVRSR